MKSHAPATLRNRDAILRVLRAELPENGVVLEIASGSGEHAIHFAAALPALTFQPSDSDPAAIASIASYQAEAALPNLRAPRTVDVIAPLWEAGLGANAVLCSNMIHIAPWDACVGLLTGASRLLAVGEPLVIYGPFRFDGKYSATSNEVFDASLRARDARWGVRDVEDLRTLGRGTSLTLTRIVEMPANNHVLVFRKASS